MDSPYFQEKVKLIRLVSQRIYTYYFLEYEDLHNFFISSILCWSFFLFEFINMIALYLI